MSAEPSFKRPGVLFEALRSPFQRDLSVKGDPVERILRYAGQNLSRRSMRQHPSIDSGERPEGIVHLHELEVRGLSGVVEQYPATSETDEAVLYIESFGNGKHVPHLRDRRPSKNRSPFFQEHFNQ
ncbi:MAG: hypothetical protein PHD35_12040 [Synergistaceae bacterium]|nr:hypothetical protein [Synergistaceae bacterium]